MEQTSSFRWRSLLCENCGAHGPEVRCKSFGEGSRREWEEECRARCIEAWNKMIAAPNKPLSEEDAGRIVFEVLRKHNEPVLWQALTSNSGPYDLLQINAEAIDLVRAIEAAHGITERKP
jgi:hypothetical protein